MHLTFYVLAAVCTVLMLYGYRKDEGLDSPAKDIVCDVAAIVGIGMFFIVPENNMPASIINVVAVCASLFSPYERKFALISIGAMVTEVIIVAFFI